MWDGRFIPSLLEPSSLPSTGTWRGTCRTFPFSACLAGLRRWEVETPDVLSTSLISSRSISAGALLWGLAFRWGWFFCWHLEKLGISQKKKREASGERSCSGCGVGDALLCPLCTALAQLSSPTPGRSSGAADSWKQTLGEVKFLPVCFPHP